MQIEGENTEGRREYKEKAGIYCRGNARLRKEGGKTEEGRIAETRRKYRKEIIIQREGENTDRSLEYTGKARIQTEVWNIQGRREYKEKTGIRGEGGKADIKRKGGNTEEI
jgi:hypothetical protein